MERIADINARFEEKYPNYCRPCGGWGGFTYWDNHGIPGPAEQCTEPCEALDFTTCHRCGEEYAMDEDGDRPCTFCKWYFNDGIIEYDEEFLPNDYEEEFVI